MDLQTDRIADNLSGKQISLQSDYSYPNITRSLTRTTQSHNPVDFACMCTEKEQRVFQLLPFHKWIYTTRINSDVG